jgi:1-phosphofructokinase family hexose kinase
MAIITVTLNVAIDALYSVERLVPGQTHTARTLSRRPAGKGINVARVCRQLGADAVALGFVGERELDIYRTDLAADGILSALTPVSGPTRVNTTIIETTGERRPETHLRSTGFSVSMSDIDAFIATLEKTTTKNDWVCVSGSLPDGVRLVDFERICRLAQSRAAGLAVDASGDALRTALAVKPDIVSPNEDELLSLALAPDIDASLAALEDLGIRLPVCTLGEDGAVCVCQGRKISARPPLIKLVSAVGAGDAFLAGFILSISKNAPVNDALAFGVRCGASAASLPESGNIDPSQCRM